MGLFFKFTFYLLYFLHPSHFFVFGLVFQNSNFFGVYVCVCELRMNLEVIKKIIKIKLMFHCIHSIHNFSRCQIHKVCAHFIS